MIKHIAIAAATVAGSFSIAFTAGTLTMPAAQASVTAPDWTQRTCSAFADWQAHPGKAALVKVVADSFRLADGKPGLASDIGQLWADYAGGGRKYIPGDIEYVRDDCGGAN